MAGKRLHGKLSGATGSGATGNAMFTILKNKQTLCAEPCAFVHSEFARIGNLAGNREDKRKLARSRGILPPGIGNCKVTVATVRTETFLTKKTVEVNATHDVEVWYILPLGEIHTVEGKVIATGSS